MERAARARSPRRPEVLAVKEVFDELRIWLGAVLMDWAISVLPPIPQVANAKFLMGEAAKSILHAYGEDD